MTSRNPWLTSLSKRASSSQTPERCLAPRKHLLKSPKKCWVIKSRMGVPHLRLRRTRSKITQQTSSRIFCSMMGPWWMNFWTKLKLLWPRRARRKRSNSKSNYRWRKLIQKLTTRKHKSWKNGYQARGLRSIRNVAKLRILSQKLEFSWRK